MPGLTDQYLDRFRHEQTDAYNPTARTRFDAFGEVRDEPTVEGFDQWGRLKRPEFRPDPKPDADAVKRNADARRRANMLMRVRKCGK